MLFGRLPMRQTRRTAGDYAGGYSENAMSTSRAIAVIGKPRAAAKDAKAEKVGKASEKITPPVETLRIQSALLLAAASVVPAKPSATILGGIHLHRQEKVGRVASADGARIFVASYQVESPVPSWMKEGITIAAEGLIKRVQLIKGVSESRFVKLTHTKGSGFVLLSDENDAAVFRVNVIAGTYPDYNAAIGTGAFVKLDEDGNVTGTEWEPVGINSRYLKHCGDIAKTLSDGLPKEDRDQNGMVIRAFAANPTAPVVFSFDKWPGAILITAPVQLASKVMPAQTAALMAPATKLTLAALRAHVTRQVAWGEAATDPVIKADHEAKAAGFRARIAEIMERTQAQVVIAEERKAAESENKAETSSGVMPDPEPQPEPATEDQDDSASAAADPVEDEPAGEDEVRPETRRTPIRVRKAA
jgi:hypothetical protein